MTEKPADEEIWYPDGELVISAHDTLLKEYGGHPGFDLGIEVFEYILKEMKNTNDIYLKAAILLRKLVTVRIFQNGHHRTGYEITKTFLEMNGLSMKEQDIQKTIRFIKGVLQCNINEIAVWIRDGKVSGTDGNSS